MTILEQLAEALVGLDADRLDSSAQEALRIHVVDTVCGSIMGAAAPDGRAAARFLTAGARGGIGTLGRAPLDLVAAYCTMTRLSEIDDIHLPSGTTPGSLVVPAAIVLSAHAETPSSARFANAVLSGYEAMTRLGAAIDGQNLVYKGIWTTYLTAPFGTAAVAARLLDLDVAKTAHALAIALTSMAGRIGRPGIAPTSRWLMAGQAARAGCLAAIAAAEGFSGDLTLLDGAWLETAHGIAADRDVFLRVPQNGSVVPEISIKPYCSAKQMIAAITAFEEILSRGVEPDTITAITVAVPRNYAAMINHGVSEGNRLSSLTSAQHQLALAAYHRDSLYDVAREAFVLTSPINALMGKVSVEVDDALAEHLPGRWPARVRVEAAGGTEEVTVLDAPGDPAHSFDLDRVTAKFLGFCERVVGDEAASEWISLASAAVSEDDALAALQQRFLALSEDRKG